MLPARVYFGQIIAVATIMLAAIWDASHWAPASLGHWTALGSAWFTDFFCVYLPWCLFEWWYGYEAYAAHVFERAGVIAVGCGFAGAPSDKLFTTYGLARWARAKEIAAAGLFKPKRVFAAEPATIRKQQLSSPAPGTLGALLIAFQRSDEFNVLDHTGRSGHGNLTNLMQPQHTIAADSIDPAFVRALGTRARTARGHAFAKRVIAPLRAACSRLARSSFHGPPLRI